ncbi:MAG: bifunctional riboflavin kinase/FAD synthetase [Planctomycetota bacterium]
MEVYRWPGGEKRIPPGNVATLGVFDGVHIGHQHILRRVREEATDNSIPSMVITFDRHPHDVLEAPSQPFITSLDHRVQLFNQLGIDRCLIIEFSQPVARMSAEEFVEDVFLDLVGAKKLVLGFDSRFGCEAEGDIELCRELGARKGMSAEEVGPVKVDGTVVSSTRIRGAVKNANLELAQKLLGRPFSLLGTMVHGAGIGEELGYPTANLDVHNELMPAEGVYATELAVAEDSYGSVTSVGHRETFPDLANGGPVVEVHVIGASLDLYGDDVEVYFKRWMRPQKRFAGSNELVRQIEKDVEFARKILHPVIS